MNLRWMMLFATIAEEGSFTRAANRLNTAQPWLSAQLRKLENELGLQLFVRDAAGVQVTPEGRALLPYAQQLSEAARMFREVGRTLGETQSRSVRIGSQLPMFDHPASRQINNEFSRRYPGFALTTSSGSAEDLIGKMLGAQLDFVFTFSPLPDGESGINVISFAPVRVCLVGPRALAPLAREGRFSGRTILAPPLEWHPALLSRAFEPLSRAGAAIRQAPEVDRRALEHLARTHDMLVLIVEGEGDEAGEGGDLFTAEVGDIGARHVLARAEGRELGRAAERYWSIAKASAREFMEPAP